MIGGRFEAQSMSDGSASDFRCSISCTGIDCIVSAWIDYIFIGFTGYFLLNVDKKHAMILNQSLSRKIGWVETISESMFCSACQISSHT